MKVSKDPIQDSYEEAWEFMRRRIGETFEWSDDWMFVHYGNPIELCWGVTNYSERFGTAELAVAADRMASRYEWAHMHYYLWDFLKLQRVTMVVAENNHQSRKSVEHMGAVLEGRARRGYLDQDALIYGLLAEDAYKFKERPCEKTDHLGARALGGVRRGRSHTVVLQG